MDPINQITLQLLGASAGDILYITTHSEQAVALQLALETYKGIVQNVLNQVPK